MPKRHKRLCLSVAQIYHNYLNRKALLQVLDYKVSAVTAQGRHPKRAHVNPGIQVPVVITDARMVFGKAQVLVTPARGVGSTWVDLSDRVQVVEFWPGEELPKELATSPCNHNGEANAVVPPAPSTPA